MAFAHRTYSSDSTFKAAKPFTMDGIDYGYDDPVDVSGIDARRLKLMFDARLLEVDDREQAAAPAAPAAPAEPTRKGRKQRQKPAAEPQSPAPQPEATPEPAEASSEPQSGSAGHKLKNGGFGRWYVANAEGDNVAGPFTGEDAKAQAEAALAKMQ